MFELILSLLIKKILRYGSEAERKALFKKFPELMFAGIAFPTTGLLTGEEVGQGKLNSGLLK